MIGIAILAAGIVSLLLGNFWFKHFGQRWHNNPSKGLIIRWAVCSIIFWGIVILVYIFLQLKPISN
jgi:hypothetical protein